MRVYFISLGAGLLVGMFYSLLNVRSPRLLWWPSSACLEFSPASSSFRSPLVSFREPAWQRWRQAKCTPHMFGMLPGSARRLTSRTRTKVEEKVHDCSGLDLSSAVASPRSTGQSLSPVPSRSRMESYCGRSAIKTLCLSPGLRTRIIDLKGRRVFPGLIDNHLHIIRGGLNFNMELRWDGVRSLADAMAMLKRQVAITPPPQWVRMVGGFTEHQFGEKRLPTIEELNAVAPDTPVFLLHLYDRALLNGAALRAVGYAKDTLNRQAGEIVRDANGNPTGLLLAKPNAAILYATLAEGPKLPFDYQVNSTRHFMRELNRLGLTGAIDAGGGFQNYPEDYAVIQKLSR